MDWLVYGWYLGSSVLFLIWLATKPLDIAFPVLTPSEDLFATAFLASLICTGFLHGAVKYACCVADRRAIRLRHLRIAVLQHGAVGLGAALLALQGTLLVPFALAAFV
jgi:hypothetical protein